MRKECCEEKTSLCCDLLNKTLRVKNEFRFRFCGLKSKLQRAFRRKNEGEVFPAKTKKDCSHTKRRERQAFIINDIFRFFTAFNGKESAAKTKNRNEIDSRISTNFFKTYVSLAQIYFRQERMKL